MPTLPLNFSKIHSPFHTHPTLCFLLFFFLFFKINSSHQFQLVLPILGYVAIHSLVNPPAVTPLKNMDSSFLSSYQLPIAPQLRTELYASLRPSIHHAETLSGLSLHRLFFRVIFIAKTLTNRLLISLITLPQG